MVNINYTSPSGSSWLVNTKLVCSTTEVRSLFCSKVTCMRSCSHVTVYLFESRSRLHALSKIIHYIYLYCRNVSSWTYIRLTNKLLKTRIACNLVCVVNVLRSNCFLQFLVVLRRSYSHSLLDLSVYRYCWYGLRGDVMWGDCKGPIVNLYIYGPRM